MTTKSLAVVLLLGALALGACKPDQIAPVPQDKPAVKPEESPFIPGVLYLELTEEYTALVEKGERPDIPGLTSMERLFPDGGEWEPRHREAGLHRWYELHFDTSIPATKAAFDVRDLPGVVSAEPVRKAKVTGYFNDPEMDNQWALYNDGSKGQNYAEGCDINVVPVWERFTTGDSDVVVAVLDQGAELNHPDLSAAVLPAVPGGSRTFINGEYEYNIQPGDHGTHCSGVIGAVSNNGKGIAGIAGGNGKNPGTRIMSLEVLRYLPNPDDPDNPIVLNGSFVNAFVYAADNGALIASNSWGDVYESESQAEGAGDRETSRAIKNAIDYFIKYAGCDKNGNQRPGSPMKGGLVVFAAGNDGWGHAWPAEYDHVVAVGSISSNRTRAYYSNYGDWVDICAPGGDYQIGPTILSCITGGTYGYMQGTSMACPQVSGVAALIVAHYGGPGFTCDDLKDKLLRGANPSGSPQFAKIGPLVDVLGSFSLESKIAPDPVTSISEEGVVANAVSLSWDVTADADDVKAYSYILLASTDKSVLEGIEDINAIPTSVITKTVKVDRLNIGEKLSYTIKNLEFSTKYYFAAIARDYKGNRSAMSPIIEVSTVENHAPEISTAHEGKIVVKSHEKVGPIVFNITEPDGHGFTTEVESGSKAFTFEGSGASIRIYIDALKVDKAGTYTSKIIATDVYGMSAEYTIEYEILPNHEPRLIGTIENIMLDAAGASTTLDVSKYFVDDDGEDLRYEVSYSSQNVVHVAPNGNLYQLTALGIGLTEVTITAYDARKVPCPAVFRVLVPDKSHHVVLYPNPVKTVLNIRSMTAGSFELIISNKAGAVVYSGSGDIDPFYPLEVDLSDKPSGTYSVDLRGSGLNESYTIAKL